VRLTDKSPFFNQQNASIIQATTRQVDLDDLIFKGRNQSYGAFLLRKHYGDNLLKSLLGGVAVFGLLLILPITMGAYFAKKPDVINYGRIVIITEIPKEEEPVVPPPPPPPVPKAPPVPATIEFMPPKVKPDLQVKNEEPPPVTDSLSNKAIGTQNIKGQPVGANLNPATAALPKAPPPPPPAAQATAKPEEPFIIVEQNPEFADGQVALFRWLNEHLSYPPVARENGVEGTVTVGFVVETDGTISNVAIKRGIAGGGAGCNDEALRVVKLMPKWKPGKQQGRAVRVVQTLPVRFKLN
jgi:periplasmic protein TonB